MRISYLILLGMLMVSITGCNTMVGVGRDLKAVGDALESAGN